MSDTNLTPAQEAAVVAFFNELEEVFGSVGRHQGHVLGKVGRCVYCSCNFRYQGDMPTDADRAECAAAYAVRESTADCRKRKD